MKNYIKEFMNDNNLKAFEMFEIVPVDLTTKVLYKGKKFFFDSYCGGNIIALTCTEDDGDNDFSGSVFSLLLSGFLEIKKLNK